MAPDKFALISSVERYFARVNELFENDEGTDELSFYGAFEVLFNDIGATLDPRVMCVNILRDRGAGHPDFGFFTADQPSHGDGQQSYQMPDRGVVEVKPSSDDSWLTAESSQVSRYWALYRQVLVTNFRDFVLIGENSAGQPVKLETLRLANSKREFRQQSKHPKRFANRVGVALGEYLSRAFSYQKSITEPSELAWLLASYAREARVRVENSEDRVPLLALRSALEQSLGVQFEGDDGPAFFRTTLVQTLFYGVFSAWVLWSRSPSTDSDDEFDWHKAVWHLRSPVLSSLFQQLSQPDRLRHLGVVELLDWAGAALNRVDRSEFFDNFEQGRAVQYFYEPFLEAFDPDLRRQLGVWYTPPEIVKYMVTRVDLALKNDLGIAEGLAADHVYVLDPCCGTGSFLAQVLHQISENLQGLGLKALIGPKILQAAKTRVFGFEIMPAPFVVAKMQMELTLLNLGTHSADEPDENTAIFLTNALTGWTAAEHDPSPFPELEEERERATQVKQDAPILVVLGNPPYNGFAGIPVDEEQELSAAYRTTNTAKKPEGQGLNDLYVRFFRIAERRITESTGQGIVCFISNYSWLDGLSFPGMRERFMSVFDEIRIDNLNGGLRTGNKTPTGEPDASVFTVPNNSQGISVGTAVATLIRKFDHKPTTSIQYRDLWGRAKRRQLIDTAMSKPSDIYDRYEPIVELGLPFKKIDKTGHWFEWPAITQLLPNSFPGVKTSRDLFLVDIDLGTLRSRVEMYFDPGVSHDQIESEFPSAMRDLSKLPADHGRTVRDTLLSMGGPTPEGFIRYTYRPFDDRWIYWDERWRLLGRPRSDYRRQIDERNLWIEARQRQAQADFTRGTLVRHLSDNFSNGLSHFIPLMLSEGALEKPSGSKSFRPNLTKTAIDYAERLGFDAEVLFFHALAVLHGPNYRSYYANTLRLDWPHIPLPGWPEGGDEFACEYIETSSEFGRRLAELLESDKPVHRVTTGELEPQLKSIAVPTTRHGQPMTGAEFDLVSDWGRLKSNQTVRPGRGNFVIRDYTARESKTLERFVPVFGESTVDVYLNERAYWCNVPAAVWNYKLGGHQVLKKWLSYRSKELLKRSLYPQEVQHFTNVARKIAAILELLDDYAVQVEDEFGIVI